MIVVGNPWGDVKVDVCSRSLSESTRMLYQSLCPSIEMLRALNLAIDEFLLQLFPSR